MYDLHSVEAPLSDAESFFYSLLAHEQGTCDSFLVVALENGLIIGALALVLCFSECTII